MPTLFILTGPNGSGKSSVGPGLLPDSIQKNFPPFDGDKLKMLKQRAFKRDTVSYKEAGKLADEFVYNEFEKLYKAALAKKEHFAYEGHFSEQSSWELIRVFKNYGYSIDMIFLGLVSPELSVDRVFKRAISGGHNVTPFDIERNYFGNLYNLNIHLELIDQLSILDTSTATPLYVAQCIKGVTNFNIEKEFIPAWGHTYLPGLFSTKAGASLKKT